VILHWKGEPYKSDVYWKPNPNGRFKTTWIPDKEFQNKSHRINFHGSEVVAPSNRHVGVLGVDPYDLIGKTADGRGSFGTIVGFAKFNGLGLMPHSFFLTYRERPNKRNDFYDDVIKACKFFSMEALIENNKHRLLEYMYDKGFTGYSMRRPDKKWKDMSFQEKKYGGLNANKWTIGDMASLLQDYIDEFIGIDMEHENRVWDIDLVVDWMKFKINDREKFDLSVASMLALMGAKHGVKQRFSVPEKDRKQLNLSIFSA